MAELGLVSDPGSTPSLTCVNTESTMSISPPQAAPRDVATMYVLATPDEVTTLTDTPSGGASWTRRRQALLVGK